MHTHANLASSLRALRAAWRFTPDDMLVNVLPLFHIHGLSFASHLSLLTGSCMHIEESFHPRRTLEIVERGTVFMGIPTFYYTFLERPEFRDVAPGVVEVRLFTCGSATIRPEVLPELESILGRPVINHYADDRGAMSSPACHSTGPWPQGSVGVPLDGIEVRVVQDDGTLAGPGVVGSVRATRPEPVPRLLATAGGHPRGIRLRLVRYGRPGLARRWRIPHPGRAEMRAAGHPRRGPAADGEGHVRSLTDF